MCIKMRFGYGARWMCVYARIGMECVSCATQTSLRSHVTVAGACYFCLLCVFALHFFSFGRLNCLWFCRLICCTYTYIWLPAWKKQLEKMCVFIVFLIFVRSTTTFFFLFYWNSIHFAYLSFAYNFFLVCPFVSKFNEKRVRFFLSRSLHNLIDNIFAFMRVWWSEEAAAKRSVLRKYL